jgi:hypothetical protein
MAYQSTSRRDDLISMFYLLASLLNGSKIPFQSEELNTFIKRKDVPEDELYSKMKETKESVSLEQICLDINGLAGCKNLEHI